MPDADRGDRFQVVKHGTRFRIEDIADPTALGKIYNYRFDAEARCAKKNERYRQAQQ